MFRVVLMFKDSRKFECFQDEPNPLPRFLKAKEGIDYVTSKGTKSQLHSFNQSYEPSCLQTQLLALAPLWILCPQFFLLGPIWVFLVPRDLQKKQGDVCIPIWPNGRGPFKLLTLHFMVLDRPTTFYNLIQWAVRAVKGKNGQDRAVKGSNSLVEVIFV